MPFDKAPASVKLAVLLAAYTGLRQGDVIRLLWSHYDGSTIHTRQHKTGGMVEIPVHQRLKAVLDSAKRMEPVIVLGERGRPFTSNGFQSRFFKLVRKLEGEGMVQRGLTFHGLRHTVGRRLAEAGCDTRTIAAVLGHRTEAMARLYAQEEDTRKRTAEAISRLERNEDKNVKQQP